MLSVIKKEHEVCCPDYEMNKALPTESSRETVTETPEGLVSDEDIKTAMKLLCEILGLPGCKKQDDNNGDARDLNQSHELLKSNIAELLQLSEEKKTQKDVSLPKSELLLPPHCGGYKEKLTDGSTLTMENIPWMVLLGYKSKNGTAWLCGGSLISTNFVLTAAHCIYGYEDILFTVKIGKHEQTIAIKEMITHNDYNKTTQKNDIGILILDNKYNSDPVPPICLPVESEFRNRYLVQSKPYVLTWDKNLKDIKDVNVSMTQVSISSTASKCTKAFPKRAIDRRVICAGSGRAGKSLCRRDNGAPLLLPVLNNVNETFYTQIGVMSFGKKCAENSVPGVYSRLTYFLPWIKKIVSEKSN